MPNATRVAQHTPVYYPPWFESYEAFRTHVNELVARKEDEIRAKAEGRS